MGNVDWTWLVWAINVQLLGVLNPCGGPLCVRLFDNIFCMTNFLSYKCSPINLQTLERKRVQLIMIEV